VPVKIWSLSQELKDLTSLAGIVRVRDCLFTPGHQLTGPTGARPEILDELAFEEIAQLAKTEQFNKQVLQYYQAQAGGRRSTLIFSKSVQHANSLVTMMEKAGIRAKAVIHNTIAAARQDNTLKVVIAPSSLHVWLSARAMTLPM
jgi:superfamily II DNA or RNA helicase